MNVEKIGRFIAKCRKEQGLTQEQLAEKLGITYKAVSKWECGKGLPGVSLYKDICEILGVSLNELFAGERLTDETFKQVADDNLLSALKNNTLPLKTKILFSLFAIFLIISSISFNIEQMIVSVISFLVAMIFAALLAMEHNKIK